jgi:hypothetical protein
VALALVGSAAAHPRPSWSGSKGPFAWQAKRHGCGVVGQQASEIAAHTRWKTSPANGYARLTFTRLVRDADTGVWQTVHRVRRSTRNTALEGERGVVHWTQWFFPFADEAGATSRHVVVFEWFRDVAGPDRRVLKRERSFRPCTVHP